MKEETGISTVDLTLVYSQSDMKNTFYYGFLCVTDCIKDSIVLQKDETIAYRWMSKNDFLNFFESSEFVSTQRCRWVPFLSKI